MNDTIAELDTKLSYKSGQKRICYSMIVGFNLHRKVAQVHIEKADLADL